MNEIVLNQDGQDTGLALPSDFEQDLSFLSPAHMPDLDAAEVGTNITPISFEFKNVGDHLRAVFSGFKMLPVKDRATGAYNQKRAAVLQTKSGVVINLGANLIKQLDFVPVGTALLITYTGLERTGSGNDVKTYQLNVLNVPANGQKQVTKADVKEQNEYTAKQADQSDGVRIWSQSQKLVLVENKCAANTQNAKGMLDLSNLSGDATEAEILKWGKAYRSHRDAMNPDTGESYTTTDAALYANGDTEPTSFPF